MSYRKYSTKNASVIESIIEFDEEFVDDVTDKKKGFSVGDTVEIVVDGKWKGVCGVVVYAAYDNYRVEPYNDPYWNNPANICKLGLFVDSDLKKIKKKAGWSTVYTGKENAVVGMASNTILNVAVAKQGGGKSVIDENDKLRKLFSGGVGKLVSEE